MIRKNIFLYLINFIISLLFICHVNAQTQFTQKILAIVNGEVITQTDIDEILAPIYLQYKSTYDEEALKKKLSEAKDDILNQLIEDKLILQYAKKKELSIEDKEVDRLIADIRSNFKSAEEFDNILKNQNITLFDLKKRYREQLLIKKTVSKEVINKIVVSPTEVNDYYNNNKDNYKIPEQIRLRNIFLSVTAESGADIEKKAADIYGQSQKGIEFIELVEKYSEAPNVIDSGDMGYLNQNELRDEIKNSVFQLPVGQVTKPIKTSSGYYIFKVEDKKEASIPSLEEVQDIIRSEIFEKKLKTKLNEWIQKLKESAFIEVKKDEKQKS